MVVSERKQSYFDKLFKLLRDHPTMFIVGADNVSSLQMQQVRAALRGKAFILMGKNTMVHKCIKMNADKLPHAVRLLPFIKGNVGFVFIEKNASISEVRKVLVSNQRAAPARPGAISPVAVTIPAGNTGMEPTKTSFFQALNIPTKITKGTVEIVSDQLILKVGDRVGNSEAALLSMLKITPFRYGLEIRVVCENGSFYDESVLDLTDEDYAASFRKAVSRIAALSLGAGIPTVASIPYSIQSGFKNVLSVALATDYPMKEAVAIKNAMSTAAAAPAVAAKAAPAAAKAAAPVKEEPKEEEDEDMGMSLFD